MKHSKSSSILKAGAVAFLIATISVAIANLSANESNGQATQSAKKTPEGNFAKGASIWANTCVRCHNMRDPKELDDFQWKATLSHMRIRAGLTGQDARDVLAFLQQSNGK
ncbi:hypothetical protein VDG1235_2943 [Verrucomicrobiia bacterium DG1235]|nr:hypothetical protein VDG1235_2943 [Verrucomicrobiae bacterium DG1235]